MLRYRLWAAAAISLTCWLITSPGASAVGNGGGTGASSSGDTIISQILGPSEGSRRSGTGDAPRCHWQTLTDRATLFIFHVAASLPELAEAPLFKAIGPHLTGGASSGLDIQVRFCDGAAQASNADVRAVPTQIATSTSLSQARSRMLTQLPPPDLHVSPQLNAQVLVNQPVFHSISSGQWSSTVTSTLRSSGDAVEVRASPSTVELASLEGGAGGRVTRCSGSGMPFAETIAATVEAQAAGADACVLRYTQPTGSHGNRDQWYGYVLMNWDGEYRINGGPWTALDGLFSVRFFGRTVRELATIIQGAD